MVLMPSPSRKLSMAIISLTMAPKTTLTVVFWFEVIFVVWSVLQKELFLNVVLTLCLQYFKRSSWTLRLPTPLFYIYLPQCTVCTW